jgi:hypothetical protein
MISLSYKTENPPGLETVLCIVFKQKHLNAFQLRSYTLHSLRATRLKNLLA